MRSTQVHCPKCGSDDIKSFGYSAHNTPRYRCCNDECQTKTFMLEYRYKAYEPGIKEQVVDMAINGSGIRDTSKVLGISKSTVINTLKKNGLAQISPDIQKIDLDSNAVIHVGLACQEPEIDEQWSYVSDKSNQRWLWYAVDHAINTVTYVFGRRTDDVFKKLKALLEHFGITKFYTGDWRAHERHADENTHIAGKKNTQKIERKNLNLRTWIKRLARKTVCFSKLERMHYIVIGLLINKIEFRVNIHAV